MAKPWDNWIPGVDKIQMQSLSDEGILTVPKTPLERHR